MVVARCASQASRCKFECKFMVVDNVLENVMMSVVPVFFAQNLLVDFSSKSV